MPRVNQPFYQFVRAVLMPTPGAMAYGFESEMMPLRPAIGSAVGARFQFCSLFPAPQYYQAAAALAQTGLTGVSHGQLVLQPLSDPYV